MIPRILLGTPISKRKAYVLDEWLEFIRTLTYPSLHIVLVDNSQDPNWHKEIITKGFNVIRVEPTGRPEAYIAKSQEAIREYAIKHNFDYLFSLECDNFAPVDIVERMLANRKDNINVPYFLKEGLETTLGVQIMGLAQPKYRRYDIPPRSSAISIFDGKLKTGCIPSIGCSLFSRALLKAQQFRVDSKQMGKFSDSFWHYDSRNNGFEPFLMTNIISQHKRNPQWNTIRQ